MKKRNYSKKEMAVIVILSIAMLTAAVLLNRFFPVDSKQTSGNRVTVSRQAVAAVTPTPTPTVMPTATPNPTEKIASFLQGPQSWGERREWSGIWGEEYYDGGKFGSFGCGLCCMANVYTTLSDYECSPLDMYRYAKKYGGYGGGGAIDWGPMKKTLKRVGIMSDVWRKPLRYAQFQKQVKESLACIVVVSSYNSNCYWKNTPGHYVTLFAYDEKKDQIFLADSGNPNHNRHQVALKKIYKSLKTSNNWQYLTVTAYRKEQDKWKHDGFGGRCVLPATWK